MADEYSTSGDTSGGSTAVLDAPPASSASDSDGSTSVGTTADTDQSGAAASTGSAEPSIPKSRFDSINTNYQRLKWAEQYRQQEIENLVAFDRRFAEDPVSAYQWLGHQLRARGIQIPQGQPQTAPQAQPQQQAQLGPDYQYVDPQTGAKSVWFSPERVQQLLEAYDKRLDERFAPLEQREAARDLHARAQSDAQRILSEAESWEGFAENKAAIWQEMANDGRISLETAYRRVVVPIIRDSARQALLAELREKPTATTASPSSAQPQGSEDLSKLSLQSLFSREMRRRGLGK